MKLKCATKTISFQWPDDDGNDNTYTIEVLLVLDGVMTVGKGLTAKGTYVPGDLPKIYIKDVSRETVNHESIHATIDFFRTLEFSFDKILDPKQGIEGEEMFVHYCSSICELVWNAISELKTTCQVHNKLEVRRTLKALEALNE